MLDLKLTLLQTELHWQNPLANRELFTRLIREQSVHSDLIVLPEMFTTGFTMDAADNAESMDGETVQWLRDIAVQTNTYLCGSLIIEDQGRYYNRLLWAAPGEPLESYDKRHLFRMADEQNHYTAGTERRVVTLGEWRICPLVCYDLRFPVWSRSRNDYDLLLYVANWPASRHSAWETLIPARAVENLCYAAGVNRTGVDGNDKAYAGGSVVADYLGQKLALADDQPIALSATLSLDKLERYRKRFPAWKDADDFTLRQDSRSQ